MSTTLPTDTTLSVYVAGIRVLDRPESADYVMTVFDPDSKRTGRVTFYDRSISFLDFMVQKMGKRLSVPVADIVWDEGEPR